MIPHSEFRIPKYEDLIHFTREALGLSESVSIELYPLEGRGSDRTFSRLKWNNKGSAILIHYDLTREENTYYAEIAEFLHDINVPVPRLIRHDSTHRLILIEDLGDTDLWSLRETPWENRRTFYHKTLAIVHRLHSFPQKGFHPDRVRLSQGFGPDLYRWEQDYFRNYFVRDVCGIELEPSLERKIDGELFILAGQLSETLRCLVHRDLQSQNVMIRDGEPFLIDFQGMRFGSPFYDLGSLLCDPYVNFSNDERNELLSFYYRFSKWTHDWSIFQNTFWKASAQRLMQALGAYGFLGLKKGLKSYLEHIPAGLRNLHLAASQVSSLPCLLELTEKCQNSIVPACRRQE
jgi:aminoglycoside/choline kinase family phosphotransferase